MSHWRFEVAPNGGYAYNSPEAQACWGACMALNAAVPLTRVRFRPTPPGADANAYDYVIEAADGRTWSQTLTFAGPTDMNPAMTFDIAQPWKLSEFALQRPVRDALVTMRARGVVEVDLRRPD